MTRADGDSPYESLVIGQKEIARRLQFVGLSEADGPLIATMTEAVLARADALTEVFLACLDPFPEAAAVTRNPELREKVRRMKRHHLEAMVRGPYDEQYVAERIELGLLYARAGLDTRVFLGAFHQFMTAVGDCMMDACPDDPRQGFASFAALKKVAFFDLSLIVDVLVYEREQTIRVQEEAIRELSTPVLRLREGLLLLPLVGVVDNNRARQLTDMLLAAIHRYRARAVVMDVTGVPLVDTAVAGRLIQTVRAAELMGAYTIVTGVSMEVAQTLVVLGVDVDPLHSRGDLEQGLHEAEQVLGRRR